MSPGTYLAKGCEAGADEVDANVWTAWQAGDDSVKFIAALSSGHYKMEIALNRLLKPLGAGFSGLRVFMVLSSSGRGKTVGDIAKRLGVHRTSAAAIVARLEQRVGDIEVPKGRVRGLNSARLPIGVGPAIRHDDAS